MNKRGELTTTQIVTIIILIVSFIVILYVLYRLNLGFTSNSEVCHNSVILKSKGGTLSGNLNCNTNYVCISGGGKCADMTSTVTVNVDATKKDQIMKTLADQISNCWWMYGEGTVSKSVFGSNTCAVCSIVEVDNTILSKNYNIPYSEFYNYLSTAKKDSTQTYLTYLYNVYDVNTLQQNYQALKDNLNTNIIGNSKYAIIVSSSPISYLPTNQISSELKCSSFLTGA